MEFKIIGTPDEIREIADRVLNETGASGIEMEEQELVMPIEQLRKLLQKELRRRRCDLWMILSIIGAVCGTMALILRLVQLFP